MNGKEDGVQPRTAYFHEDDFCQIEVLPERNWQDCVTRFRQLARFSEEHLAPGGQGWTDIHVRAGAAIPLVELRLEWAALTGFLARMLPAFEDVRTGYGDYSEACPNARAFGAEEKGMIYCSEGSAGFVDHLWLDLGEAPSHDVHEAFRDALVALSALADLILVDWNQLCLVRLGNASDVTMYLAKQYQWLREIEMRHGRGV